MRPGAPPLAPTVMQHSVPVRVSVVMVDETPGLSDQNLSSTPVGGLSRPISGAAPPADEAVIMCSVVLPTIAGAAPPAEVAEGVAVDAVSLADAGILFPADPTGGGGGGGFRPTLLRGLPL